MPLARVVEAEAEHPGAFVVVDGVWPATPIELELIEPEQPASELESIEPEQPASEAEPITETQPAALALKETQSGDLISIQGEPAPAVIHSPQTQTGRRHDQRGRGHGKR